MKDLKVKLNELESMLREDGYNGSNIVIETLSEIQDTVNSGHIFYIYPDELELKLKQYE